MRLPALPFDRSTKVGTVMIFASSGSSLEGEVCTATSSKDLSPLEVMTLTLFEP